MSMYKVNHKDLFYKTLEKYLKPVMNLKDLNVLDLGCETWFYKNSLFNFLNQFGCNYLLGVDCNERLITSSLKLVQKPLEFKLTKVEDLGEEFNESFDLITNFRPYCKNLSLFIKEQYKKCYELLKKEGVYFGTTYDEEEKNDLVPVIKDSGLKIISVDRNELDPMELQHGWVIIAKK